MKFAAIDIGSNAVRLIFVNVYETENGVQYVKDAMYRVAFRLGEEAFINGEFSEKKTKDILSTMKAYKHLIAIHQPVQVMACATSAMRDAKNSGVIVEKVFKKTGIKIEVISGHREAEFVLSNHVETLDLKHHHNYLYIDVGGGSTELILLSKGKTIDKQSFNIGTLRISMGNDKKEQWRLMQKWLTEISTKYKHIQGIGVGGNINTIQKSFAKAKSIFVHEHDIQNTLDKLEHLSIDERIIQFGLRPDRADVIVPAAKIFKFIMNHANISSLMVPKVGLGDGMIHYMYEHYK
ncbi:MAG: ethanolamine ammonia-lyase reactivating factor EutA [Sphingobacteriales bacterium]|nr:MAG: ethanolamine ammonia-lyase reactivating factor EutA [Sphingobacteriales bacterium]